MVSTKTKKLVSTKKKAVKSLMELSIPKSGTKKFNEVVAKVAEDYKLSVGQVLRSYYNFLNDKKIDLRIGKRNSQTVNAKFKKKTLAKIKKIQKFPVSNLPTNEKISLIHEYFFSSNLKISDFLLVNKISFNEWYGWLKSIERTGRIDKKRIMQYNKYGKFGIKPILYYAKALTRTHKSFNKELTKSAKSSKYLRSLTKDEEAITRRLVKVLYYYTSTK